VRVLTRPEVIAENDRTWSALFGPSVPPPADDEGELDRILVAAHAMADRLKFIPELYLPTAEARFQFALGHCWLRRLEETGRCV
jgi:hypothetical protein